MFYGFQCVDLSNSNNNVSVCVFFLQTKLKDILDNWQEKSDEVDSVALDASGKGLSVACEQDASGGLASYSQALESGSSMIIDPEHSLYIVTGGLSQLASLEDNQVRPVSSSCSNHKD